MCSLASRWRSVELGGRAPLALGRCASGRFAPRRRLVGGWLSACNANGGGAGLQLVYQMSCDS